jgi:DNA replicative helicase MCM subunit Mcm2 (Cdc46/Mcm family)
MRDKVEEVQGEISMDLLRKYVTYAKMKFSPRLSEEAGQML